MRKPRTYEYSDALRIFRDIKTILKKSRKGLTVNEVASFIDRTPRMTRDYLKYLHGKRELFVAGWVDSAAGRGKKLARYKVRDAEQEDAPQWWKGD